MLDNRANVALDECETQSPETLLRANLVETSLGWVSLVYDDYELHALRFGSKNPRAATAAIADFNAEWEDVPPSWIADLSERLIEFADGEPDDFGDVHVNTDKLTPFGERVVAECRKLRWGQVASYGEIAKRAGRPRAARAVGSVMSNNQVPLVIPCHRVVGASGSLGGYSAPGGLATKRRLLGMEQG